MKCLEKERGLRYETVNGLAEDVARYLNDDAVEACPPTVVYKVRKFVRRNRAAATVAFIVACLLITSVVGTTGGLIRARQRADVMRSVRLARFRFHH